MNQNIWNILFVTSAVLLLGVNCQPTAVPDSYYPYNGVGNNVQNPNWHSFPREVKRSHLPTPYFYEDGLSVPRKEPNPRVVSNMIGGQAPLRTSNTRRVNLLHLAWSQYASHDIGRYLRSSTETVSFPLPDNDVSLPLKRIEFQRSYTCNETSPNKTSTVNSKLEFVIARTVPPANQNSSQPRNFQQNTTPCFDNELFYPRSEAALVGFFDQNTGKIYIDSDGNLLPGRGYNWIYEPVIVYLLAMEHNSYIDDLKISYPNLQWTGRQYYNAARKWTIAVYQSITMYEYGQVLFGALPPYSGYNSTLDPVQLPEIGPVLVHYSYSEFPGRVYILDEDGSSVTDTFSQRETIQSPKIAEIYKTYGFDSLLRGAVYSLQDAVDLYFSEEMRNGLAISGDAFSSILFRSREVGLPKYNDMRRAYGLNPVRSFQDISPQLSQSTINRLSELYNGSVDELDFFIGGHAEFRNTSHMGPLFTNIYRKYFLTLRNSDRFWFENTNPDGPGFTEDEILQLRYIKISDLIIKHTHVERVPCSSFFSITADCPSAPPINPQCPPSSNETSVYLIDNNLAARFGQVNPTSRTLAVQLAARTPGWVSIGFPTVSGRMIGTWAFAGSVNETGFVRMNTYYISGRPICTDGVGVCVNNTKYTISRVSGSEVDGLTSLFFTISPVTPGRNIPILVAYGTDDFVSYHGSNKGAANINLYNEGTFDTTPAPTIATPAPTTPVPTQRCSSALSSSVSALWFLGFFFSLSIFFFTL